MRAFGFSVGSISDSDVGRLRSSAPTYDHIGSTLQPSDRFCGPRYEDRVSVGSGHSAFVFARSALRSWAPQRSLGATIRPPDANQQLNETVVLLLGVGPLRLVVPTRVVVMIDEPDRYAYAYGTLPGHPERGEELFDIQRHPDDNVVLTIRVDATPAPALRPVGVIVRALQRAALRRYLTTVAEQVHRDGRAERP